MPPKKGVGTSKGKQPAKRPPAKRAPPPALSSSDDEGVDGAQQEILARIAALESSRGVSAASVGGAKRPRSTRASSRVAFQTEVLKRLSALEGTANQGGDDASGAIEPGETDLPGESGTDDQAGSQVALPVAVAVDNALGDGAVAHRGRCSILICGHSFVFWAAHQAKRTAFGSQLGLSQWATVEWQGRRGLRWPGLLPLLFEGRCAPPPHILVIHLGGNDLGLVKGKALSLQAQADLRLIGKRWPGVLIIWSDILPRRVWREALDAKAIEGARYKANKALHKALEKGLGVYLPHPGIRAALPDLYRGDGVHLSFKGNNIFLDDLRRGLLEALRHIWGVEA
ncbi:uncharacterized protein LOC129343873 [Eublepharis macularius]|uniref:Uncharacterized protein LOC129326301 n=1 Tax=Eublepharis macularius TaxID=481883 RepID=A0AA97LI31_EUBMA|nr:uncharacterized protein LOC129326301 [Eublepharis macularius]XP_054845605.1 uncharacterized protein LOC129336502 [Eublepharis macularius]XP_054856231.1 uncharacterized protein LOC129343873 [Eublepharis macularius]